MTDVTGDGGPIDDANRRFFVGTQTEDNRQPASRRPEEADERPRRHRRSSPVQRRLDAVTTTHPVVARWMILMTDG